MDNLTPITREEILMNDEPLTPITREEKILAGEDLNPVTRREYFLKKYRHAGGDVMVEGLSVTANGTYTAPEDKAYSPVEVDVPLPENAYLLKTASGSLVSFSDGADLPMPSFVCNIDAVQDLHGYDRPWPPGGGKNKLQNTRTTREINGVTFTVNSDGSVTANGTATAEAQFAIPIDTSTVYGDLYFVGCSGGSNATYNVFMWDNTANNRVKKWNGTTNSASSTDGTLQEIKIVQGNTVNMDLRIVSGQTVENVTFYPMICLATETDPTFAPYSNICPISGHTRVDAWVRGKNLYNNEVGNLSVNGVTFTKNADGSITTSGTSTSNAYYNMSNVVLPKGTYIANGCPSGGADNKYKISVYNNSTLVTIGTGDTGEGAQFEADGESEYRLFIRIANNQDMNGFTFYPMIRLATETDATYEPYNPNSQTIQVSWQTEVGEVFDGYVDLVSGVLTVTHKSQTGFTRGSQDSSNKLYNIGTISDIKAYTNVSAISPYFVDSMFEKMSIAGARAAETPSIAHYNRALYVGGYIGKEAELDTLLETLQVKYELETPIIYQLTPQQIKSLLGNNNAWCSTGDVDIDYFAKEVTG